MAISIPDFRIRFPEFADNTEYPDVRIQMFIDDTVLYIGDDELRWGNKYDTAQAYLTAHLLSLGTGLEASGGNAPAKVGAITSKSAGGVSVTRASSSKTHSDEDEFYMSTAYGQQFIVLRNRCFVGALVAL